MNPWGERPVFAPANRPCLPPSQLINYSTLHFHYTPLSLLCIPNLQDIRAPRIAIASRHSADTSLVAIAKRHWVSGDVLYVAVFAALSNS